MKDSVRLIPSATIQLFAGLCLLLAATPFASDALAQGNSEVLQITRTERALLAEVSIFNPSSNDYVGARILLICHAVTGEEIRLQAAASGFPDLGSPPSLPPDLRGVDAHARIDGGFPAGRASPVTLVFGGRAAAESASCRDVAALSFW